MAELNRWEAEQVIQVSPDILMLEQYMLTEIPGRRGQTPGTCRGGADRPEMLLEMAQLSTQIPRRTNKAL